MNADDLLVRACESIAGYLELGNECFEAHGGVFVRNRAAAGRYDANHVGRVRTADPVEIEALFARTEREFAGFGHRRIDIDPLTPPAFEARLAIEPGYRANGSTLTLVLEGELQASPPAHDIREVLTEADWHTLGELSLADWEEYDAKSGRKTDASMLPDYITYKRAKRPHDRTWLAYVQDEAVGFFSSWPGGNGVGQIEDLFVRAEYRHRGIATALLAHCVADARARGAGPVLICADPDDTPKNMYRAMGFRPLFVPRTYLKRIETGD